MNPELVLRKLTTKGTIVRAYSPAGYYWRSGFACSTAAYVTEADLIFTACHFDQDAHRGEYYSEFDEPTVEEIRFLGALILPIGNACGMLPLYPLLASVKIDEFIDFRERGAVSRLSEILRSEIKPDTDQPWSDGPLPVAFGGRPYEYRDAPIPRAILQRIYEAIDPNDHTLIRGLGALIRSGMLSRHRHLFETAHHEIFTAMDASFQLVLAKLAAMGMVNPSSADAADFIHETFGGPGPTQGYFSDYYEDRIRLIHPASRYGVAPYAPLGHCHFFGLYDDLRDVYRWLVLGEVVDLQPV
jgi:hypothetical protein